MDKCSLKDLTQQLNEMRSRLKKAPRFAGKAKIFDQAESFLKQHLLDRVFIGNAINLSYLSHCVSRQVGCVIEKDGRTLSTGINGTSCGDENCDDLFPHVGFDAKAHREWSDVNEAHAELNAINWAAKLGISLDGSTLYCTLQPCLQCSKNLPAVGIKRIVFKDLYDRVDSYEDQRLHLFKKGVIIEKLMDESELLDYLQRLNYILENN